MSEADDMKQIMQTVEGFGSALSVHTRFKSFRHQVMDIYVLSSNSTALPSTARSVISEIYSSDAQVYDRADPPHTITCSIPGAMRSWHQNDSDFLPTIEFDPGDLTGKAKRYHDYIVATKGLQNKQVQKGYDQVYTGYIEYTPCATTESTRARICYDYVQNHVYYTPSHYTPFTMEYDTSGFFPKVTNLQIQTQYKSVRGEQLWNPWVYVRP